MNARYDAAIVGAGPAGSGLARTLARKGLRVLLADREAPGERPVCGGFLGPEVAHHFDESGLGDAFRRAAPHEIETATVSSPSGARFETRLRRGGRAVDRSVFDRWLSSEAGSVGAEVTRGTLDSAEREGGGWTLWFKTPSGPREISARFLVRAHGRRSAERREPYFACRSVFEGSLRRETDVALHFTRSGHTGLNPLGGGKVAMCLYVSRSTLQSSKADLDRMVARLRAENVSLDRELGAARRTDPWKCCAAEPDGRLEFRDGQGAFLVGDAVSMMDPVVGGGIPAALGSAEELAAVLGGAGASADEASLERDYARRWKARFLGRWRLARWLGLAERSRTASRVLFGAFGACPSLFGALVSATRPKRIE